MTLILGVNKMADLLINSEDGQLDKFHPTNKQMTLINQYTGGDIEQEDLFVRNVKACDNKLDRHLEVFETKALKKIVKSIPGTIALKNHDNSCDSAWGKNFDAKFMTDPDLKGGLPDVMPDGIKNNEPQTEYEYVMASQYTLRTEDNSNLINNIIAGIDFAVSVGFSFSVFDIKCSICGENIFERDENYNYKCPHLPGRRYPEDENKYCYKKIANIKEFYEISNVGIPAQPLAGTIKTLEMINIKEANIQKLEKELEDIDLNNIKYHEWNLGLRDKLLTIKMSTLMEKIKVDEQKDKTKETDKKEEIEKTTEVSNLSEETVKTLLNEVKDELLKGIDSLSEAFKNINDVLFKQSDAVKMFEDVNEKLKDADVKLEAFSELAKSLDEKIKVLQETEKGTIERLALGDDIADLKKMFNK